MTNEKTIAKGVRGGVVGAVLLLAVLAVVLWASVETIWPSGEDPAARMQRIESENQRQADAFRRELEAIGP